MQGQNYSFEELKSELLERLEARGCTPVTITGYRYQCNSIFAWFKENGYGSYSKEGGIAFLQDYYNKSFPICRTIDFWQTGLHLSSAVPVDVLV